LEQKSFFAGLVDPKQGQFEQFYHQYFNHFHFGVAVQVVNAANDN
jgi:hypothetical protein